MGPASPDLSTSGHAAPDCRRHRRLHLQLRGRRRHSPSPSPTATSQELTPSSSSASGTPSLYPSSPAPSAYVPVAPLPVFRGGPGECPAAHLARFDRACRANNAGGPADGARIFPASLDDDAALWYEVTTSRFPSSPPWHATRNAFLDFFRSPGAADRARAELMSLRQRPGETVNRFHLRMQGILLRCPDHAADVPDMFLKGVFVDGLRADFQDWVLPQRPETLDEAVALAASWERAESVREARRAAKAAADGGDKCGFCGAEGHEEARCEVRRRVRESWLRSYSGRGSAVVGKEAEEEEGVGSKRLARLGSAVSTRSVQCQCRKHRCWKKAAAGDGAGGWEENGTATATAEK